MTEEYLSGLIAAGVSAVVAISILLIKEKLIEPQKIKKNIHIETLEKKLEVYGRLATLIEAAEENAKGNPLCKSQNTTHVLDYPVDEEKLKDIFERSRHLLSIDLIDEYLRFVKEKKTFHSTSSSTGRQTSYTICNLSDMEECAENEFYDLKEEYNKLIK